jgi:CRISPR system Cascade subunit CasC
MSRFLQIHLLTTYPPSNLNRDDLGTPKRALFGGVPRLRISSQCLKRAWRTSDVFKASLDGQMGTRTRRIGHLARDVLLQAGANEKNATTWASQIAASFGKLKEKGGLEIEQIALVGHDELETINDLAQTLAARESQATDEELERIHSKTTATDCAMFGRMMADSPQFNAEAAVQVAHALTVNKAPIESDFFTAVDDLNEYAGEEGAGSAHMGEIEYGAGIYYQYICVNRDLLVENLGGDKERADQAITALIDAAATVAPSGKQATFGSRARASYILAEVGDQQPRSLVEAFLEPTDKIEEAVDKLEHLVEQFDNAYGPCAESRATLNVSSGSGALADIKKVAQHV